ncbi:hypothetical protein NDU88_004226 [Pleurodeles waltl]|uniref:Uncharacterized protein n=1 Tax=Pleurodeles waltl TaxID=8319 RepID=A0AAV7KXS0_PLEWA|nr:hypothetical protein NDU88_004226 [Pleurodeles waltl]
MPCGADRKCELNMYITRTRPSRLSRAAACAGLLTPRGGSRGRGGAETRRCLCKCFASDLAAISTRRQRERRNPLVKANIVPLWCCEGWKREGVAGRFLSPFSV